MKKISSKIFDGLYRQLALLTVALLCVCTCKAQNSPVEGTPALVSGQAIVGASPGRFALPSLSGYVMGTAVVKKGSPPALFVESDERNPGTYLYYFTKFTASGAPVFSEGIPLQLPFDDKNTRGCIVQDAQMNIWGFWQSGKKISVYKFNTGNLLFEEPRSIEIKGLPSGASSFGVGEIQKGKYVFLFGVPNKKEPAEQEMKFDSLYYTPEGFWPVSLPETGIYGALTNDLINTSSIETKQLTSLSEIYYQFSGYTFYKEAGATYTIAGTRMGNFYAYKISEKPFSLEKHYVVDTAGILQREPSIHGFPGYIKISDTRQGFIASGEAGIYYYENSMRKDKKGDLIFKQPRTVMQEDPVLYGGSLVVPDLADWDGNGTMDIISGSSDGRILFFRNTGTNSTPLYQAPVFLEAGGRVIHIQPGYREDIQGPGEARWGYTCPTVVDWNEDGLPDLLTGDSRGKFMVYINRGSKTSPRLEPEHPLYFKGMDVHGAWRTKPGAGKLGKRMAYIILDKENQFHLYWKLDDYNLEDGGKLPLTDSTFISANRRSGGQVGRANTHLVDWDEDGVTDMLVGTGRAMSIPNPVNGLPYYRKKKNEGGAVLFLRNAGTNEKPVFEFPKLLKYKGQDMLFGAHSCSPTTAYIGESKTLNLVVGVESGRYMYYEKKDLSW